MELYIDAKCDTGKVREHNEDMILFLNEPLRDDAREFQYSGKLMQACLALTVCDGMGGANGGEVASERTILSLQEYMSIDMSLQYDYQQMCDGLRSWQQQIHCLLLNAEKTDSSLEGMGCTLVGLFFVHGHIFHSNCGDSRLYRLRDNTLKQLTRDHSLREELGNDTVAGNVIVNSIGGGSHTYMDIVDMTESVLNSDIYLLCSDGLSDMLTDKEIADILCSTPTANALVTAANEKGGADNISVCLIQVGYIDPVSDFSQSAEEISLQEDRKPDVKKTSLVDVLEVTDEESAAMDIDFRHVLTEVKHMLDLYHFVYKPQHFPYMEAFIRQVSDSYPQVYETRQLAELVSHVLLSNILRRHVQTGGIFGVKKISALITLDEADFIYRPY